MNTFTFPTIFSVEKNGKTRMWNAIVQSYANGHATATITYGQLDGKQQTSVRNYTEGKNKGKTNETTPYEQCFSETERKWKDKKEKESYSENLMVTASVTKIFPMLAATYSTQSSKKNDIVYPCFVQPKLDGLRCVMYKQNGQIMAQSRTGSYFETLEYLTKSMEPVFNKYPNLVLDGELYTMDIPFEILAGLLKKKHITKEDSEKLEKHVCYHVYDLVTEEPFFKRHEFLSQLVFPKYIQLVYTLEISSVQDFKSCFSNFVVTGYEGIMLRNKNGMYKTGYRSNDLQKYKEFMEEEYVIIGFEEGDGRDKGCVIWVCQTNGKEFRVRPRGTILQRREWFQKGSTYVGKKLTVIFQELSEQGIPRFPVGKAIRDEY